MESIVELNNNNKNVIEFVTSNKEIWECPFKLADFFLWGCGYNDSTYDLQINEESSIKILSDKAVDDEERYFNMEGDFNVNEENTEMHS